MFYMTSVTAGDRQPGKGKWVKAMSSWMFYIKYNNNTSR